MLGALPDATLHPFHAIATDEWREMIRDREKLIETMGLGPQTRAIIGFGDPWTTPLPQLMSALDETSPQSPLIGGMASEHRRKDESADRK